MGCGGSKARLRKFVNEGLKGPPPPRDKSSALPSGEHLKQKEKLTPLERYKLKNLFIPRKQHNLLIKDIDHRHDITPVEIDEIKSSPLPTGEAFNQGEMLPPEEEPILIVKEEIVQIEQIDEEDKTGIEEIQETEIDLPEKHTICDPRTAGEVQDESVTTDDHGLTESDNIKNVECHDDQETFHNTETNINEDEILREEAKIESANIQSNNDKESDELNSKAEKKQEDEMRKSSDDNDENIIDNEKTSDENNEVIVDEAVGNNDETTDKNVEVIDNPDEAIDRNDTAIDIKDEVTPKGNEAFEDQIKNNEVPKELDDTDQSDQIKSDHTEIVREEGKSTENEEPIDEVPIEIVNIDQSDQIKSENTEIVQEEGKSPEKEEPNDGDLGNTETEPQIEKEDDREIAIIEKENEAGKNIEDITEHDDNVDTVNDEDIDITNDKNLSEEAINPAAVSEEDSTEVTSGNKTEDLSEETEEAVGDEGEKSPDVIEESKGKTDSGLDAALENETEESSEKTEEGKDNLGEGNELAAETTEEITEKVGINPEPVENLETDGNIE